MLASMAKLKSARLGREIADACLQYYGGMGYMNETPISRAYRDVRLWSIGAGTDETMLSIIAKRMGIPLTEVADEFDRLPADRMPSARDWERISRHWRGRLEARRLELERMERELTGCIGCGCLSLSTCRVFNPGDALAADGPGPRRLPEIPPE